MVAEAPLFSLLRSVPNGYRDNTVTENITDVRVGFEGVADMMGKVVLVELTFKQRLMILITKLLTR